MKNTKDIRVIRTQAAILEALSVLVQKQKLTSITITDLCAQAKINRNTFYYHYNNIFEFLDEHQKIVLADLAKVAEHAKIHSKEIHVELCYALKKHPYFLNILLSPNCDVDYYNDIFSAASKVTEVFNSGNKKPTGKEKYISIYTNHGTNAIIRSWILTGMKETPEEIGDIIWEVSSKGPFNLMKLK